MVRILHRSVLLFLLALLPLQFAAAAVGKYCQHEAGPASQHFGHHEHKCVGHADNDSEPSRGLHPDCGTCHASTAVFPDHSGHHAVQPVSDSAILARPLVSIPPPVFEPEKPNWLRLA